MAPVRSEQLPPSKKRKKESQPETPPTWETTRFFHQPKTQLSSLPFVHENSGVRRPPNSSNASHPRFAAKAMSHNGRPGVGTGNNTQAKSDPAAVLTGDAVALVTKTSSRLPLSKLPRKPSTAQTDRNISNSSVALLQRGSRKPKDTYALKLVALEQAKVEIASMATSIIAKPQQHVGKLKQLRQMAVQHKGPIALHALLTETQLYKDLAPAYRIRNITEKEAEIKVSKDVAILRSFEQTLLSCYQRFVRSCVSISRRRATGNTQTSAARDMIQARNAACKVLSELLRSLPHFNEAEVLVTAVCSLATDREESIRSLASEALTALLSEAHKSSGQTLQTCIAISKALADSAASKARIASEEIVAPLSVINFAAFPKLPPSQKKAEPRKGKRLSKRKREMAAKKNPESKEPDLEHDLAEGDADASPQEMFTARKALLDAVCHACFNVVKVASSDVMEDGKRNPLGGKSTTIRTRKPPPALSPALRGLQRVSHYVNTNVVEAIIAALAPMLSAPRYPLKIRFRCISVAYTILSFHARAQQSDPDSFTSDAQAMDSSLYSALGELFGLESRMADAESTLLDAIEAVLAAHSYRQVPPSRASALARCLCIQACSSAPTHACSIGLMKAGQLLLDPMLVSSIFAQSIDDRGDGKTALEMDTGVVQDFDMNAKDPDVSNAERSAAWELSSLMCHFHPAVRDVAANCAQGYCGPRLPKSTEDIVVIAKKHRSHEGGFNPAPQENFLRPQKRKQYRNLLYDEAVTLVLSDAENRRMFLLSDDDCGNYFESNWREHGDSNCDI